MTTLKILFALAFVTACLAANAQAPSAAHLTPDSEVAFGPEGGAEALILKHIAGAKSAIRVAAFAFSSPVIVDALTAACKRGVDVQLVVDHKHNVDTDPKGIGRKALDTLVQAGAVARTNAHYRIHHDKFIIVDRRDVQTGSYNYAVSANRNSENVLIIRNNPALTAHYLAHWESRFHEGAPYPARKM
jgi:phosphatidylserine/phosphatidylglycerophosphate/cardiolipin synthase-like enzyme